MSQARSVRHHTMATYLSRFDRRPAGALLTRVNMYLSFLTFSTLPTSLSNFPRSLKVDVLQCHWLAAPVITPHSTFT
ncbi:Glycerol-1-phosphate phosphohydrolase 2 [Fusarium oxysporum f. sp. albedinis]|nr:Glycerol-1-phosphate phosphohydrolase 2 [Fusarium oxysporum f. sp. albedinis]